MALWEKAKCTLPWLPAYTRQRFMRQLTEIRPLHLVIGVADHFEPMNRSGTSRTVIPLREQEERLEKWCRKYPVAVDRWRDTDGHPFRHTYFYPAEDYSERLVDRLVEHCHAGWGEVEIQLHHGVESPDSAENTLRTLTEFRDALTARGCLSRESGSDASRYGFVHGNWALANSDHGKLCGVSEEMQILADTGCYADFTLPAPSGAQVKKINALYECGLPLNHRAPHRRGIDLQTDRTPEIFPLIFQGPLMLDFARRKNGWPYPGIENSELSGANPPTLRRLQLWQDAAITVRGKPEWLFIKLHCHGLESKDEPAMFGTSIQNFLRELVSSPQNETDYRLHFVTMREMTNIALAACEGCEGNPGEYREHRFQLIETAVRS